MATETETLPLIRTKLYRPRITGELVPRPRLLERLEQRRERALTLVVAPAGYGRTTLISSWLQACDCPSAWVSLCALSSRPCAAQAAADALLGDNPAAGESGIDQTLA